MTSLKITIAIAAALGGLAAGCVAPGDPGDGPGLSDDALGEQDYDEVGRALAATLTRQLSPWDGLVQTSAETAMGAAPAWLDPLEGGVWVGELLGLRYEISLICRGAGGAEASCGPSVDLVELGAEVSGQLSIFTWTGALGLAVNWQLAGLQGEALALGGGAEIELRSELVEWFRPVTHETRFLIRGDYALEVRRVDRLPLAGSASFSISYQRRRSDLGERARFELAVEVEIEEGFATFSIGGHGFRVDLRTGAIERVSP